MAKLKTPLLSLDAHGSLSDSLTFQRRPGDTTARKKPTPSQPHTLLQTYHRWDYQDGIFYWKELSTAHKQQWRLDAAPHHMTGFAYFMRWYLLNLPDIIARWRLDERAGILAYDTSKNTHHATIFGALHVPAYIDYGIWCDGIDDMLNAGNHPLLKFRKNPVTIEFLSNIPLVPAGIISGGGHHDGPNDWYIERAGALLIFKLRYGGIVEGTGLWQNIGSAANKWEHITIVRDVALSQHRFLLNGQLSYTSAPVTVVDVNDTKDLWIAEARFSLHDYLDNLILWNRVLSPLQIQNHSERRWPQ